jgi:hypothetical protein
MQEGLHGFMDGYIVCGSHVDMGGNFTGAIIWKKKRAGIILKAR